MWCIIWWSLGPISGSSGRGSTVSGERAGLGLRQRSPSRAAARPRHRTLEKSALAAGFEEEPGALLGFIGPVVVQAVGRVLLCLPGGVLGVAKRARKGVVAGKSVSVRVTHGGGRNINKKIKN